ncbi:uncharacterized protein LOC120359106 [Solenopsis invicta]|uniref:uncharacterized protein LOC120359106 n=1 Tax=Solenopsis invicta TaxID=13686 RepID=UPI00193EA5DC|nr:uncharacterized protein LOC120359106 [Solenopsis invicta]
MASRKVPGYGGGSGRRAGERANRHRCWQVVGLGTGLRKPHTYKLRLTLLSGARENGPGGTPGSVICSSCDKRNIIAAVFLPHVSGALIEPPYATVLSRSRRQNFSRIRVPEFVRSSLIRSLAVLERHLNLERKWSSRKWSSDGSVVLQRAILIPSYDWDSSRVSGGHPIRIHVLRRSSERAKLFDQRERKISGILPEAVNLTRKPILLTLIGPMTETEERDSNRAYHIVDSLPGRRLFRRAVCQSRGGKSNEECAEHVGVTILTSLIKQPHYRVRI